MIISKLLKIQNRELIRLLCVMQSLSVSPKFNLLKVEFRYLWLRTDPITQVSSVVTHCVITKPRPFFSLSVLCEPLSDLCQNKPCIPLPSLQCGPRLKTISIISYWFKSWFRFLCLHLVFHSSKRSTESIKVWTSIWIFPLEMEIDCLKSHLV